MKVLLIHNFYHSSAPSGEDIVFKSEVELLRKKGIQVITNERYNDEIAKVNRLKVAVETIRSRKTYKELLDLIKREKPNIAHFHNIWYLISPSAYYACQEMGVPVVQTLHNFRIFCVNGLMMRNGKVCEDCLGRVPWRGVVKGCYRNSVFYSTPVALTEFIHKIAKTWENKVDAYIALTEFVKKKYIEGGLPEEKIFIKPNFLANPPEPCFAHKGYAIFLGRLSMEKGLYTLIEAWKDIKGFTLKMVGDGPLKEGLKEFALKYGIDNIEWMGRKTHQECLKLLKGSMFVVLPSQCYENFPMTILEAFACGKPVIASNLGAMAELVEDGKTGLLFEPGNPEDLANKMKWMIEHEDVCIEMGRNARSEFEAKYTAEKNYKILMDIYRSVLGEK